MSRFQVRFLVRAELARVIAAVVFVMCLVSASAQAQYRRRVVLLDPSHDTTLGLELQSRLRGELTAAGFDVVLWPTTDVADPEQAVETTASELGPAAVLLVRLVPSEDGAELAELWISDRLLRRVFVQRARIDPEQRSRGSAALAVQAVELLKARLAELAVSGQTAPKPAPAPSPPPQGTPPPAPERHATGFGLSGGAGLLHGFGEIDSVWTPVFQLSVSMPALGDAPLALDLRATLSAFAGTANVEAGTSSAGVEQAFGTLDAVVRFAPTSPVQPLMALGTGAYTVDVEGRAAAPLDEHTERTWSALNSIGAGLIVEPITGITCKLEASLLGAWSETIVRIRGDEVAQAGSPMLLVSAGLGGVF